VNQSLLKTLYQASVALQAANEIAVTMGDPVLAARIHEQGVEVLRLIGRVATRKTEVQP
jgi:hypothetical protein